METKTLQDFSYTDSPGRSVLVLTLQNYMLSSDQNPGDLLYIGDEKLPRYVRIIMNHDKAPY